MILSKSSSNELFQVKLNDNRAFQSFFYNREMLNSYFVIESILKHLAILTKFKTKFSFLNFYEAFVFNLVDIFDDFVNCC